MRKSIGNYEYASILLTFLNTHCWPLMWTFKCHSKLAAIGFHLAKSKDVETTAWTLYTVYVETTPVYTEFEVPVA